jgi:hypothetical protein
LSTTTLSIRGLPEWLIRVYFEEMGAAADPASAAGADGEPSGMDAGDWSVTWTSQRVALPGGTLGLTQFDIVFEADDGALETATEAFMKKAQRGGG